MNPAFGMSGYQEVILIVVVIVLLFGAKKLPELSRSLGRSLSEFKKGREEGANMLKDEKADHKDDEKADHKGE